MQAFKFRTNDQLEFAFDVLFKNRLFCAPRDSLNDPMEGWYGMMPPTFMEDARAAQEKVEEFQQRLRICSLSDTVGEHLLWSYYGSGFKGLAIEVDIPEPTNYDPRVDQGLVRVKRVDCEHGARLGKLPYDDQQAAAYEALASKERQWGHLHEVRIIADKDALDEGCYFQLSSKPKALYVGCRMSPTSKMALGVICAALEIPFAHVTPQNVGVPSVVIGFDKQLKLAGKTIVLPDPSWVRA